MSRASLTMQLPCSKRQSAGTATLSSRVVTARTHSLSALPSLPNPCHGHGSKTLLPKLTRSPGRRSSLSTTRHVPALACMQAVISSSTHPKKKSNRLPYRHTCISMGLGRMLLSSCKQACRWETVSRSTRSSISSVKRPKYLQPTSSGGGG